MEYTGYNELWIRNEVYYGWVQNLGKTAVFIFNKDNIPRIRGYPFKAYTVPLSWITVDGKLFDERNVRVRMLNSEGYPQFIDTYIR